MKYQQIMKRANSNLCEKIRLLKKERKAIILAHNYQVPEIQDIADHVGDSLGLSRKAQETDAEIIVFCGVRFMAETAKILNPERKVILPDINAGCSLEDSCQADDLRKYLSENAKKNYYIISYINCSAEVKSLSDIICTSGNAEIIVRKAPRNRPILFLPDANLGSWVLEKTGRSMDIWKGACHVHLEFTQNSISKIKEQYPHAPLVAHPECTPSVRLLADIVCSTEKMINYCQGAKETEFIIATESGILHRLKKEIPQKKFIPAPTTNCACSECKYMKMNTLQKLYLCLRDLTPEIQFKKEILQKARKPLKEMLIQS